jgi:hypothetical protein
MASGAFITHCLFVNIGMARIAFRLCFRKFKRCMTVLAGNNLVLTYQREICGLMIEINSIQVHFPAVGLVAIVTICSETITMW